METKFCKLPLDFGALLSEDVENSRLESCSEIESIDQLLNCWLVQLRVSIPLTRSLAVRFLSWLRKYCVTYTLGRTVLRIYHYSCYHIWKETDQCQCACNYRRHNVAGQYVWNIKYKEESSGLCIWKSGSYRRKKDILLCDLLRTYFNTITVWVKKIQ